MVGCAEWHCCPLWILVPGDNELRLAVMQLMMFRWISGVTVTITFEMRRSSIDTVLHSLLKKFVKEAFSMVWTCNSRRYELAS